jgi:acetyl-CoA acetyltransferase
MNPQHVFIAGMARTPMGSFQGELSSVTAPYLGAAAIAGALKTSGAAASAVEDVYMGCVLPAGVGQAPARQASIHGGIPDSVPCTTVSKVCGSGMKALMVADTSATAARIRPGRSPTAGSPSTENASRRSRRSGPLLAADSERQKRPPPANPTLPLPLPERLSAPAALLKGGRRNARAK